MLRWLSRKFNMLLYVKFFSHEERHFTTTGGLQARLYFDADKNTVTHVVLERGENAPRRDFADTYPLWSFSPASVIWQKVVGYASEDHHAVIPKDICCELMVERLGYQRDGDFFYDNVDGAIFSISRIDVVELNKEIKRLEGSVNEQLGT